MLVLRVLLGQGFEVRHTEAGAGQAYYDMLALLILLRRSRDQVPVYCCDGVATK